MAKQVFLILASCLVVEHLTHLPKVKGLILSCNAVVEHMTQNPKVWELSSNAGTLRENDKKCV
jgi:hypothetical protein